MTSYLKQAREWATPVRTSSAFLTKGVLTPDEFVRAGDELVFKCPTWSWEGGDPSRARGHLPKDKQYLVTRNVPCPMRATSIENTLLGETEVEMSDNDAALSDSGGGWLMSHLLQPAELQPPPEIEDEFDLVDADGEVIPKKSPPTPPPSVQEEKNGDNQEDDDEYADMENFEDANVLVDDSAIAPPQLSSTTTSSSQSNSNILKVRTYDLSITYDKYYQTPRLWMFGYAPDSVTPLTAEEMFADVMSDYVRRTVTIESHPHVPGPHLSIHPCQHAAVMKNIIENMMSAAAAGQQDPNVEMYLFIFLKFVSSIIPTIHYDFTMEVEANVERNR